MSFLEYAKFSSLKEGGRFTIYLSRARPHKQQIRLPDVRSLLFHSSFIKLRRLTYQRDTQGSLRVLLIHQKPLEHYCFKVYSVSDEFA